MVQWQELKRCGNGNGIWNERKVCKRHSDLQSSTQYVHCWWTAQESGSSTWKKRKVLLVWLHAVDSFFHFPFVSSSCCPLIVWALKCFGIQCPSPHKLCEREGCRMEGGRERGIYYLLVPTFSIFIIKIELFYFRLWVISIWELFTLPAAGTPVHWVFWRWMTPARIKAWPCIVSEKKKHWLVLELKSRALKWTNNLPVEEKDVFSHPNKSGISNSEGDLKH